MVAELKHFPLDSLEGVLTRTGVELDSKVSYDGNGSLKITAAGPAVVRLFETGDIDVENARLIYQAKVRTQDLEGKVYLELWCHFPGKGDFFSRDLDTPLTDSVEWVSLETPFFLRKGENPAYAKLNIVINGKGTVWIDDVRLIKGPLH